MEVLLFDQNQETLLDCNCLARCYPDAGRDYRCQRVGFYGRQTPLRPSFSEPAGFCRLMGCGKSFFHPLFTFETYNSLPFLGEPERSAHRMTGRTAHGRGLRVIAAFKLLKAAALVAVGVGALKLLHKDVAAIAEHWINMFQVDPRNHFINLLLAKLSILDDRRLKELSLGTFIYAGIFLLEGVGLALEKRWAEYFTIITTSSLLPIEIYELARRASIGRCLALGINLAVVAYLIFELRRFPKKH